MNIFKTVNKWWILLMIGFTCSNVAAQTVPVTTVPTGYGRYCSIRYPGGGWAFATLTGADSDPCRSLLQSSPGGTIERAGLWATGGGNNVLVRCDGDVGIYRETGSKATSIAFKNSAGKQNCVFTVSPTRLPVFGLPYGKTTPSQLHPSIDVSVARGFDYNVYNLDMDVNDFGQQPKASHPKAHWVDRKGRQRCFIAQNGNHVDGEAAYDWLMPEGKPLLAVANGIVRSARWRDVSSFGCGDDKQGEIYIEHKIGTGIYAERFVSYYAHMSNISVKDGDRVTRGQKIGEVGNTGCSSGNHLHLSVLRLTNLSGHRSYTFQTTPNGYGINGIHGIIDPFGWVAPKHIDPWAWKFLGNRQDPYLGNIKDPGAFSINLWRNGAAPPSDW